MIPLKRMRHDHLCKRRARFPDQEARGLLVLGILLMAFGFGGEATWLTVLELLLPVWSATLLVLKIVRRNQTGLP